MQIGIAYAEPDRQIWLKLEVPKGCTLLEAVSISGILDRYPQVDLERQKVGIFGKISKLDTPLQEGDRVEIYRPITVDPTKVKRRKLNTT